MRETETEKEREREREGGGGEKGYRRNKLCIIIINSFKFIMFYRILFQLS